MFLKLDPDCMILSVEKGTFEGQFLGAGSLAFFGVGWPSAFAQTAAPRIFQESPFFRTFFFFFLPYVNVRNYSFFRMQNQGITSQDQYVHQNPRPRGGARLCGNRPQRRRGPGQAGNSICS